jgi:hypothetical protein
VKERFDSTPFCAFCEYCGASHGSEEEFKRCEQDAYQPKKTGSLEEFNEWEKNNPPKETNMMELRYKLTQNGKHKELVWTGWKAWLAYVSVWALGAFLLVSTVVGAARLLGFN